jgi:hypothetical protein
MPAPCNAAQGYFFFFEAFFFAAGRAAGLANFFATFLDAVGFLGATAAFLLPLVKAASQPSEYFFVVPTRTMVTAIYLSNNAIEANRGSSEPQFPRVGWLP